MMQKANEQQKHLSSEQFIINKKNLLSFLGFIFVTVLLYFGLGRPDLLQPQMHQKKLERAYVIDGNHSTDTDENAKLLLLYKKLKKTLAKLAITKYCFGQSQFHIPQSGLIGLSRFSLGLVQGVPKKSSQ